VTDRPPDEVRRRPPDKQQDRPEERPAGSPTTKKEITQESTATARQAARERLRVVDHRHRNASACERVAPLTVFYGPRPLVFVGLAELLARGRWAA
jgi:hypothetical protein